METWETEQARILIKMACDRGAALERENADLRKRLWALVGAQTRLADMLAARLAEDARFSEALMAQRGRDETGTGRDEPETGRDEAETGRDESETGRDETETGRDESEMERRREYKIIGPGGDACTVYIRGGGIVRVFEVLLRDCPGIPLRDWSVSEVIREQRKRDKTETGREPHKPKRAV